MLTINIKPLRISFTFGFFFVLGITTLRECGIGVWSLLFCILHELGHLCAMLVLGAEISQITFYGAGIKIISDGISDLPPLRQAAIYLCGPAVNLALAAILHGVPSAINLFLGAFNLLPLSYFDGGRLAVLALGGRRGVLRALNVLSVIAIGALALTAVINSEGAFEPSSLIYFGFIVMAYFLDA